MIRINAIVEALMGVVGWNQSYDPAKQIDTDLTVSQSGLNFQAAHPLVTLANVESIMPEEFQMQYKDWNQVLTYKIGAKVKHNGQLYIALKENKDQEPIVGDFSYDFNADFDKDAYWKPYNMLSDFLRNETKNGITTVFQTFISEKLINKETKVLMERRSLFDGAGRLANTVDNQDRLVGFEITPVRSMGVTTKIDKIGLQFIGGSAKITLYIFHSSMVDPYMTLELNYDANGSFKWFDIDDLYLPYISDSTNAGGSWYAVYDQSTLPLGMSAINVSKDWSREPCQGCNVGDVQTWRELTKYMSIMPLKHKVPEGFAENPTMFDVADNMYTNAANYGLNMQVSVGCDLSDFIIDQKMIFANVIQKQVAANILRTMAMNPDVRVNRRQSNASKMDILYELDGNTEANRPSGIGAELRKQYKALDISVKGLDRICLSCNNGGVKYRTV